MEDGADPKRMDNEAETSKLTTLATEMTRMRCTLAELLREKSQWSTRLVGIQNLAQQLQEKKEELNSVTKKLERTQETLSRAENTITQLSIILEKNGVSSQGAIAKQVFCELIVTENESMKEKLLSDKGEKVVNVGRLKEAIGSVAEAHPDVRDILNGVWDDASDAGQDESDARHEDARETVEDGEVAEGMTKLEDAKRETNRLGKELENKQSVLEGETEMLRNKLTDMEEEQDLLRGELEKAKTESEENAKLVESLRKKLSSLQGDIFQTTRQRDDFQAQLKEVQDELQQTHLVLTSFVKKEREAGGDPEALKKVVECEREKVAKLQRDILQTTRQRDDFQAKLKEVQDELQLAQMALKSYEDDFKKERQEKLKAAGDLEAMKKENHRLAGECERFQKNYLDLTHRIHQGYSSATTGVGAFRPRAECRKSVQAPPSRPRVQASNELQCPTCQRMFPSHLLDDHMRACSS